MSKPKDFHACASESFRQLLKEARLAKGLSQAELAGNLRRPQSYVSKYETGERRLDFVETAFVCEALGTDIEDLAHLFALRLKATMRRRGK